MKTTVNIYTFREAFNRMGRGDQFSYAGLAVLFDYLEQFEDEYELDVVSLCCAFAESDALTIANDYRIDLGEEAVCAENVQTIVREYLCDQGALVGETDEGAFVYGQF